VLLPSLLPLALVVDLLPRSKSLPFGLVAGMAATWLTHTWLIGLFFAALTIYWALPKTSFLDVRAPVYVYTGLTVTVVMTGYLLRDSLFFPPYFLDALPFLAVFGGVLLVDTARANDLSLENITALAAVAVLLSATVLPFLVYPVLLPVTGLSLGYVQSVGDDLQTRTEPGERIFTMSPQYAIEANRRPHADISREFWILRQHPESNASAVLEQRMLDGLGTEQVPYVLDDQRMKRLRNQHPSINDTVTSCYDLVLSDERYRGLVSLRRLNTSSACP